MVEIVGPYSCLIKRASYLKWVDVILFEDWKYRLQINSYLNPKNFPSPKRKKHWWEILRV